MKTARIGAAIIALILFAGRPLSATAQGFDGRWNGLFNCGQHALMPDLGPFTRKVEFIIKDGAITGRYDYLTRLGIPVAALFTGRIDRVGNTQINVTARQQDGRDNFRETLQGRATSGSGVALTGMMLDGRGQAVRSCELTLNAIVPEQPRVALTERQPAHSAPGTAFQTPPVTEPVPQAAVPLPQVPHYDTEPASPPAAPEPEPSAPVAQRETPAPPSPAPTPTPVTATVAPASFSLAAVLSGLVVVAALGFLAYSIIWILREKPSMAVAVGRVPTNVPPEPLIRRVAKPAPVREPEIAVPTTAIPAEPVPVERQLDPEPELPPPAPIPAVAADPVISSVPAKEPKPEPRPERDGKENEQLLHPDIHNILIRFAHTLENYWNAIPRKVGNQVIIGTIIITAFLVFWSVNRETTGQQHLDACAAAMQEGARGSTVYSDPFFGAKNVFLSAEFVTHNCAMASSGIPMCNSDEDYDIWAVHISSNGKPATIYCHLRRGIRF